MTRTRLILIASCIIVFAAGAAAGLLFSELNAPRRTHGGGAAEGPRPRSWLVQELKLTPQQAEQMQKIWEPPAGAHQGRRDEHMAALARERDQAVVALLTEEQKAKYDAILQDHAQKVDELSKERRKAFEDRVAQTKLILTPEQAARYEELLKEPRGHGHGRGRGPQSGPGGPGEPPDGAAGAPPPPPPPPGPDGQAGVVPAAATSPAN
jgi:Spy/CpxP family protein refolding chaperone